MNTLLYNAIRLKMKVNDGGFELRTIDRAYTDPERAYHAVLWVGLHKRTQPRDGRLYLQMLGGGDWNLEEIRADIADAKDARREVMEMYSCQK